MAITPWKTSDDLIESISRKIAIPIAQGTFSEEDILAFATEEMFISQVPSVMQYHEEYFVWTVETPLVAGRFRYSVPDRAIGMKIRDLFYRDSNGNLFEMDRISEEDKAHFQRGAGGGLSQSVAKYYLEGNDIILAQSDVVNPAGSLQISFYLRPNVLVPNDRAATITSFTKTVTVDNSTLAAGDILIVDGTEFEAVAGGATGNQFVIGATSILSATALSSAITASEEATAVSGGTAVVTLTYSDITLEIEADQASTGFTIQETQGVTFDAVPTHIIDGVTVDVLQTKSGHSMRAYGIELSTGAVSGDTITFESDDLPDNVVVGDYLCIENECIIPQIPTDLHSGLAERTCARILASIGDQAGLAASNAKIQEIDQRQSAMLGNRVEGSPIKVRPRNSLLSFGKRTFWR